MHTPATRPSGLESAREQLAGFLSTPLIQAPERAWSPASDTAELLNKAADKAGPRRFSAEPITGFGAFA